MGNPTSILGYEPEWIVLAQALEKHGNQTLPLNSTKLAQNMRRRFYGFRRAMANHDAANPLVAVLMETQATITDNGDLHFQRNPYGALLRGMLEHSIVHEAQPPTPAPAGQTAPNVISESQLEDGIAAHDKTILDILDKKVPPSHLK